MTTSAAKTTTVRRAGPRARAAAAVAIIAVTAGCSSNTNHGTAARTTAAPSVTSTTAAVSSSTTTTVDPNVDAVLTAYRAHWDDFIAVAEAFPVKPLDPRLAAHTTGRQLTSEQQALTRLSLQGRYASGTIEPHPVVQSLTGSTAVVVDCGFDHSVELDGKSHAVVEGPDVGHTQAQATLSLVDGRWLVSDSTILKSGAKEDTCTPSD